MKQYRLIINIPQVVLVTANNEEEAIEAVKKQLLQKPCDPCNIQVVEE